MLNVTSSSLRALQPSKAVDRRLVLPISAVIATADRPEALAKCIETIVRQDVRIKEIVVADASGKDDTRRFCESSVLAARWPSDGDSSDENVETRLVYLRTRVRGAAPQRNEGVPAATQPFILFMDDDVELRENCLAKLWEAVISDQSIGGVSSMIVNQKYASPGIVSRLLYSIVSGERRETFAGRCLGPVLALLPEDREELPEVVPVEWLNTTCTLYRREALPVPVFPTHFTGYSIAEDINLSLTVGKTWKLVNARTARIYHNSGQGPYKPTGMAHSKMALLNRHYIMTKTLGRASISDYIKLLLVETFGIVTALRSPKAWLELPAVLLGKIQAVGAIISNAARDLSTYWQ